MPLNTHFAFYSGNLKHENVRRRSVCDLLTQGAGRDPAFYPPLIHPFLFVTSSWEWTVRLRNVPIAKENTETHLRDGAATPPLAHSLLRAGKDDLREKSP